MLTSHDSKIIGSPPSGETAKLVTRPRYSDIKQASIQLDVKSNVVVTAAKLATGSLMIGGSDYKSMVVERGLLIDKSLFIKQIIDDKSKVKLITRPRRVGKSLNMSMLKYFFEQTNQDNTGLFKNKDIWKAGELYQKEQGQYQVLFVTFKDVKQKIFVKAKEHIYDIIISLYKQYKKLLFDGVLRDEEDEIRDYQQIIDGKANDIKLEKALFKLSEYLRKASKRNVIVLIDEYDIPTNTGYEYHYYQEIADLIRDILSPLLKDNLNLHMAVLTGILRTPRESFFSGLNNSRIYSVFSDRTYASSFGFLLREVQNLLEVTGIPASLISNLQYWYGGYQIGSETLFNTWSIVNFVNDYALSVDNVIYKSYWLETSENKIVKDLFHNPNDLIKQDTMQLLRNKPIVREIDEHIMSADIGNDINRFWSFLLLSGYLTVRSTRQDQSAGTIVTELVVPNYELFHLYQSLMTPVSKEQFIFSIIDQSVARGTAANMTVTSNTSMSKPNTAPLITPGLALNGEQGYPAWCSFELAVHLDDLFSIHQESMSQRGTLIRDKLKHKVCSTEGNRYRRLLAPEIRCALGVTKIITEYRSKLHFNVDSAWRIADLFGIADVILHAEAKSANNKASIKKKFWLLLSEPKKKRAAQLLRYGLTMYPKKFFSSDIAHSVDRYLEADSAALDDIQKLSKMSGGVEIRNAMTECKNILNKNQVGDALTANQFYQFLQKPQQQTKYPYAWKQYQDCYQKNIANQEQRLNDLCADSKTVQHYVTDCYNNQVQVLIHGHFDSSQQHTSMANVIALVLNARIIIYEIQTESSVATWREIYRIEDPTSSSDNEICIQFDNKEGYKTLKKSEEWVSALRSLGLFGHSASHLNMDASVIITDYLCHKIVDRKKLDYWHPHK